MRDGFERLCARILGDLRLLVPLLAANVAGMAFGWYYYFEVGQFDPRSDYFEHPAWWPLVADSPNAVALFFVAAVLRRWGGWRHPVLDAFAFCLNIYVGLWTTFVFLAYAPQMGTFEGGTNSLLFVTHMGMPLQALLLAPDLRRDGWRWRHTLLLLAAYVAVDYSGPHLHPAPFLDDQADDGGRTLHAGSPWLMVAAFAAFAAVAHVGTGQRPDTALRRQTP
jgi:uncharacterized membrane protein YpjA